MTTLAADRYALLLTRLPENMLAPAVEELSRMAAEGHWVAQAASEEFREMVAEVAVDGTMAGDLRRAWDKLTERLVDEEVRARVDAVISRVTLGAATDGELSAAIFAYPDDSYLLLVDHGLMLSTWLTSQLAAVLYMESPVEGAVQTGDAVAAVRLAIARPAVGARAGFLPALLLQQRPFALAASLAREMDVFLIAHELSHVLLGHFRSGATGLHALAGPSRLPDEGPADEHSADLLALTLMLDDVFQGRTGTEHAPVRIAAVRLVLAVIEAFERACFVIQPASHPPGRERFAYLKSTALKAWFGEEVETILGPLESFAQALEARPTEDAALAVGRVERGLSPILDRQLWRAHDWSELAQLASLVAPTSGASRRALRPWFSETESSNDLSRLLAELVADDSTQKLLAASASGAPLTRLAFLDHVQGLLNQHRLEHFPVWAVAGLMTDVLRRTDFARLR